MSAQPVDVLARIAAVWGEGSQEYAAVAELVEAARKLVNRPGIAGMCGDDEISLRRALARVQGGAA